MKKMLLLVGSILILITVLVFLYYNYSDIKTPRAKINGRIFNLEIAVNQKEKEVGLAKYKSIPQNFGMLFPFEKSDYHSFWMKNMQFPIDIIYIKENKIIKIFKNVPYPTKTNEQLQIYTPTKPSDTVLEINAGLSEKYNFKDGDGVEIKL